MRNELYMWIVYEKPLDHPTKFIARKWSLDKPTKIYHSADTLEEIRKKIPPNLYNLGRQPGDDPKIVEVWI